MRYRFLIAEKGLQIPFQNTVDYKSTVTTDFRYGLHGFLFFLTEEQKVLYSYVSYVLMSKKQSASSAFNFIFVFLVHLLNFHYLYRKLRRWNHSLFEPTPRANWHSYMHPMSVPVPPARNYRCGLSATPNCATLCNAADSLRTARPSPPIRCG